MAIGFQATTFIFERSSGVGGWGTCFSIMDQSIRSGFNINQKSLETMEMPWIFQPNSLDEESRWNSLALCVHVGIQLFELLPQRLTARRSPTGRGCFFWGKPPIMMRQSAGNIGKSLTNGGCNGTIFYYVWFCKVTENDCINWEMCVYRCIICTLQNLPNTCDIWSTIACPTWSSIAVSCTEWTIPNFRPFGGCYKSSQVGLYTINSHNLRMAYACASQITAAGVANCQRETSSAPLVGLLHCNLTNPPSSLDDLMVRACVITGEYLSYSGCCHVETSEIYVGRW